MKPKHLWCVAAAWLGLVGPVFSQTPPTTTLVIGVVPQFPPLELQRRWGPVLTWLEDQCQFKTRLEFAPSIPEFEDKFQEGRYDLVYLNPYHAVMARQAQGYAPLVREGKDMLKGVLVVQSQGAVQQLSDLQGSTLAFPAPNAFGASLYMRALLEREHGIAFKAYYAKTHGNAYRHVIKGEALGAGGIAATLAGETPEVRGQLRVLYETPPAAPHPLAAHPRVDIAIQRCVTRSLTPNVATEPLKAWLQGIQMPNPVPANYARDYQALEKLKLEKYVIDNTP